MKIMLILQRISFF